MFDKQSHERVLTELRSFFAANLDKRISVVGASCIGKTTLLLDMPNCIDGDDIVWEQMPRDARAKLKSAPEPWTSETVDIFKGYAKTTVFKIKAGTPVFCCGVFGIGEMDCDLIVWLNISDANYLERVAMRKKNPETMLRHKAKVEKAVKDATIPVIVVRLD